MNMNQSKKLGTIIFKRKPTKEENELKETLVSVYQALGEKGLDPIQQIVGYIISEDPTYITSYKDARSKIQKIDRYELLSILLRNYLNI